MTLSLSETQMGVGKILLTKCLRHAYNAAMTETASTTVRLRPSTHKALITRARRERLTLDGLIWRLLTAQDGQKATASGSGQKSPVSRS